MDTLQICFCVLLCCFYTTYFVKMLTLKRQHIHGDILGKGDKPRAACATELTLKAATYSGALLQFCSVLFPKLLHPLSAGLPQRIVGVAFGAVGCLFLILSVAVMKMNWRAGFQANQNTTLVTSGIYRISRNPAFVGFDLLYISCALAFPNAAIIAATMLIVCLFHIQILGEEGHLLTTFGADYAQYKARVGRYFGRKNIFCP